MKATAVHLCGHYTCHFTQLPPPLVVRVIIIKPIYYVLYIFSFICTTWNRTVIIFTRRRLDVPTSCSVRSCEAPVRLQLGICQLYSMIGFQTNLYLIECTRNYWKKTWAIKTTISTIVSEFLCSQNLRNFQAF